MNLLDWLGRVVMLALAGLVTLSIIGSIAAIPSGAPLSLPERPLPPLEQVPPPVAEENEPRPRPTSGAPIRAPDAPASGAIAPPPADDPANWLEAITYALLALVGLAALACLLLWRGLRRIGDELTRARP